MNDIDPVLRFRPPRIAMSLVAAALVIHYALPLPLHSSQPLIAATVASVGFMIMIRAWWLFRHANTAICPTDRSTTLLTNDIFSLSRNPMYLGMGLMLAAAGLIFGTPGFYIATLGYFAVIGRHFIPFEERVLTQQYGDAYVAYSSRVRRWM